MPEIVPFRGIRFDPRRTPPGAQVCPPYDVIDAAQHARLLEHHERNAVRIVLGDDAAQPQGDAAEYRRRGAMVRGWLAEGTLQRDDAPSYSLYEFAYSNLHGKRASYRGVLGALKAKEWGKGVRRHEQIRPKVVDDRLGLLRESGVDSGVVQLVDRGLDTELDPFFRSAGEPFLDADDFQGDHHRLWIVDEPEKVAAIEDLLASRSSIVADGHHRYTTALRLGGEDSRPGAGHILTMIGDLEQDGLVIEPTHRILHLDSAEQVDALTKKIVSELDDNTGEPWRLERRGGAVIEGRTRSDLKKKTFAERIATIWGNVETIENVHDLYKARVQLDEIGDHALLCVLPPVTKDEFWTRCESDEVFPPKTTYFEPKIATGLVLRLIEEEMR